MRQSTRKRQLTCVGLLVEVRDAGVGSISFSPIFSVNPAMAPELEKKPIITCATVGSLPIYDIYL